MKKFLQAIVLISVLPFGAPSPSRASDEASALTSVADSAADEGDDEDEGDEDSGDDYGLGSLLQGDAGAAILEQIETLRELIEPQVGEAISRVDFESIYVANSEKIQVNLKSDLVGFLLEKTAQFGAEIPAEIQEYLQNIEKISITSYHPNAEKRTAGYGRIQIQLKKMMSFNTVSGRKVRHYEINRVVIPKNLSYALRGVKNGSGEMIVKLQADSPRKNNALRLHSHSLVGHIWLREASYNVSTQKLSVQAGVAGNTVELRGTMDMGAEKPRLRPDLGGTLKANLPLLLFGPALLFIAL